jgi:ribosomal protein S20
MKMKKTIATLALAGAVTAGTLGVAATAYAADSSSGGSTSTTTPARHPRLRLYVRRHAVRLVASTLGVTTDDLRAALKSGQSITEYAQSLNKDPQTVKDALVNGADKLIDKAVEKGVIDESKANDLKAKVPDRIDKLMNRHFGQNATA